jgi:acetyl esterase/lipase
VLRRVASLALRATLLVSPRPAALLVRRAFAAGGAALAESLERHAPADVVTLLDERYGEEPDMLLDLYRPGGAEGPLPLVLWVHGGGWVGGSKEEIGGYCKLLAGAGLAVAAPRYSLAPEHRYPTPARQAMAALAFLRREAERLQLDADRIAVAGDSAGAHVAAQLGALVTTPGYAAALGVEPALAAEQLRCLVLACGPYDLELARRPASPLGRRFMRAVLWAYSGKRGFLDDPAFATWSVVDHVGPAFPPVLVTVGNADPLAPHSERFVAALRAQGVEPETVFFPDDHRPPLGHEYQFDLDGDAGRLFLERAVRFLHERLGAGTPASA